MNTIYKDTTYNCNLCKLNEKSLSVFKQRLSFSNIFIWIYHTLIISLRNSEEINYS